MDNGSFILRVTGVALSFLVAAGCLADPPSVTGLATKPPPLSQDEKGNIATYAEFWGQKLVEAKDDPEQVKKAHRRLFDPLRIPGVTASFLNEYSRGAIGSLEEAIRVGSPHAAVNSINIVSFLGTESALEMLLDESTLRDEPRQFLRLTAARGCRELLAGERLASVNARKITSAARRLRDAARTEPEKLVLRYQLEAVLSADRADLPEASRRQIRGYLVDAIESVMERCAEDLEPDHAVELFDATYPVLDTLLEAFLKLDVGSQQDFGQKLGPCLGAVLNVPETRWDDAQTEPGSKTRYGRVINLTEQLLVRVNATLGASPAINTHLKEAWDAGDTAKYRSDLDRWQAVLSEAPY